LLSEGSQSAMCRMAPTRWHSGKAETVETGKPSSCWVWGQIGRDEQGECRGRSGQHVTL
jgi:hypothetical protein